MRTLKIRTKALYGWLLPVLLLGALQTEAQDLRLDSCYRWAFEHYPALQSEQHLQQQSELRADTWHTNYLPKLTAWAQAGYQSDVTHIDISLPGMSINPPPKDQYKLALDVQQVVYDGGLTKLMVEAERLRTNTEVAQLRAEAYGQVNLVNDVFFGLVALQKSEAQLALLENELKTTLQTVESGVRNGVLLPGSADEVRLGLLQLAQQQARVRSGIKSSVAMLRQITGKEIPANPTPVFSGSAQETESARYETTAFANQKAQLELLQRAEQHKRLPTVGAFAQAGYANPALNMLKDAWETYYIVGIKAQWNIWDWGTSRRKRQEYALSVATVDSREAGFTQKLELAALREQQKIDELQETLAADKDVIELQERIVARSQTQLEQGVLSTTDYLKRQTQLSQAKLLYQLHESELAKAHQSLRLVWGLSF